MRLTVREPGNGRFTLKVRSPAWADGATVQVDGRTTKVPPGTLASVKRD